MKGDKTMKVITEKDISITMCNNCEEYHFTTNEDMTRQIYIITSKEKEQLKQKLKDDIRENITPCDMLSEIISDIENVIDNNW